ncbi:MAG: T9SS type A sorting domain-containing protein [Bacteroidales bacterium]|nr:T9SS type A sorting domain-containing protein [Candidatus Latescibacterota bacterium]
MKEFDLTEELDTPVKAGASICYSHSVLRGKGSIRLDWFLTASVEGAVFSVQRSPSSRGNFREISEIRVASGELTFRYSDTDCQPGASYRYRIVYHPVCGDSRILFQTKKYLAVAVPTALHTNRPNPFDTSTELRFSVAEKGKVSLSVYDVEGRLVRDLVNSTLEAGSYGKDWDGQNDSGSLVAAGVYFCRLRAGHKEITMKLILMR